MPAALEHIHARMRRVLGYIDRHLDETLDLEMLSKVAAYSKFHFHRQFSACFGLSVHRYIQLARFKRASQRLAYMDTVTVTEIALESGYESPDALARGFRRRLGQSPSQFRKSPDWEPWSAAFEPLEDARSKMMQDDFGPNDVTIRDVPPTRVAIMRHRESPATLGATIRRFIAWRKAEGLHPSKHPTFNIWHSERVPEDPDHYSVDLCVGTDGVINPRGEAITEGEIPGGRCAVLRVIGHTDDLEPAARYLYSEWLPHSGEDVRDFPIYCQRVRFFPEVPEHEAVADLFLPLKQGRRAPSLPSTPRLNTKHVS